VSFFSLDLVHPITHAVVNTIKRVILILFSVVAFGTAMTVQSSVGSAIAISGVSHTRSQSSSWPRSQMLPRRRRRCDCASEWSA